MDDCALLHVTQCLEVEGKVEYMTWCLAGNAADVRVKMVLGFTLFNTGVNIDASVVAGKNLMQL